MYHFFCPGCGPLDKFAQKLYLLRMRLLQVLCAMRVANDRSLWLKGLRFRGAGRVRGVRGSRGGRGTLH